VNHGIVVHRCDDCHRECSVCSGPPAESTELLAKYFRGLGDPTRLCILRLLDEAGELPVGEIVSRRELCVIDPDGHGHMVAELQPDSVGRDPAST